MDPWELVDERDRWMVRERDIEALLKLGSEGIKKLLAQDDTFRLASFMTELDNGSDEKTAAKKVRKSFPYFYISPTDREFPEMENEEDANLPLAVKKRLGIFNLMKAKKRAAGYSSFNACVRDLLRSGVLK